MAIFSITVDVSPLATAIELYYTYIKPDGTTSSPAQKYTGAGVGGFIVLPPTPHPVGYTYTINNVVLNDNTVYNFEIKQFCVDQTVLYSPIDEDHYNVDCIDFTPQLGAFDYLIEEYPIVVNWSVGGAGFDPNNYSIQDYILTVGYMAAATPGGPIVSITDTIPIPAVPATVPSSGYTYSITSDDLTTNLIYGNTYVINLSFNIILSTGATELVECENQKVVQIPYLKTYKIHTGEAWVVDWIDENNLHQRACNFNPAPNIGANPACEGKWIWIYHRFNPGPITSTSPYYPICGQCFTSTGVAAQYYNMYLASPTLYNSDRVNCYYVKAGVGPNPSTAPCRGDCSDDGNNNINPSWGATWQFIGDGYVPKPPGTVNAPAYNINSMCIGAPNW